MNAIVNLSYLRSEHGNMKLLLHEEEILREIVKANYEGILICVAGIDFTYVETCQYISKLYLSVWDMCVEYECFKLQCTIIPIVFNQPSRDLQFKSIIDVLNEVNSDKVYHFYTFDSSAALLIQKHENITIKSLDQSPTTVKFTDEMIYFDEQLLMNTFPAGVSAVSNQTNLAELPSFNQVACGGTFDNFHCGHKILLTLALAICKVELTIGITGEGLLVNKKNGNQIKPTEYRRNSVCEFLETIIKCDDHKCIKSDDGNEHKSVFHRMDTSYVVHLPTLLDGYGPTITNPNIQAIIVSSETIHGALKANAIRQSKGFNPMYIYVVKRNNTATLSSTFLRKYAAGAGSDGISANNSVDSNK